METVRYIRIDSIGELRAWFILLFSDNINNMPVDKQDKFADTLTNVEFMRNALDRYYACKFDMDWIDNIYLSL